MGTTGSARPISRIETKSGELHFAIPTQWENGTEDLSFQFSKTDQFKSVYADVRKDADGLDEQQTIDFIKAYFSEQYLSH